ncbi:hypothetical protein QSH57_002854 [Fusarium oxysporum f. sp. vasinfectum]|nr:hypothetical protein QSH57_002854 [Fusarium oxysporum f. sp. vasinfectum]
MDNNDLMKYEGDRLVTNTDVDAPTGWTNDFERVRGHEWQENGNIANILGAAGIKGKAKPLFAFE